MAREAKDVHLLVVPDLGGFPEGIRVSLMKEGYTTAISPSIEEVAKELPKHRSPVIIANCGEEESEAIQFVKNLIKRKSLHSVPVFLVGKDAESFESTLEKYFPVVATLPTPLKRGQVIDALQYIIARYPSRDDGPLQIVEMPEVSMTSEPFIPLTETDLPTLVFSQISQLPASDYGGKELKQRVTFEKLESLGLTPTEPHVKEAVNDVQKRLGIWSSDHILRTTFICDRFQSALGVPDNLRNAANHAALLIPSGFSNHSLSLLRANYLTATDDSRARLASKLKDSALFIIGDLEEKAIAQAITLMSKQIAEEQAPNDSVEHLSASLLAASELINRTCYQNGYWEPQHAHFLIRSATNGKLDMLHPLSTACMMKFLSEAVAELPKTFQISKFQKINPELIEKARENEAYEPQENERKIPISFLEPGMKLSRPIYSFDGREIVGSEIQLDQDLIWRLWRLSTIRPMNTPLVVEEKGL